MVTQSPQLIPEVEIMLRPLKVFDGVPYVSFTKEEIERSAQPFKFSLVMKFMRQRPSLDIIRAFIRSRWGLDSKPVVSAMLKARSVFVRFSNELDFIKAFSRETCDVEGVSYHIFQWYPEFDEENESPLVPIWITLPGLPPNFYHESFLRNITMPLGQYILQDNSTRCATRTDGARVCIKMDASKNPLDSFWIGIPHQATSRLQEVVYETLPTYCYRCRMQGHNVSTCKWEGGMKTEERYQGEGGREKKVWVRKEARKSAGHREQDRAEISKRVEVVDLEEGLLNKNDDIGEETGE
ncbi:uncharacterized protein LOC121253324 [Juglans microcarpa x Juglans regia]|uniref:uncharacterized protein LOC121253324 n=1 Tax=Juglans microcarpa x Juglans regia TaxID=2249226 RepID=UPI001B7F4CCB|nr:uncharacterized protein LOC121253324 [Juglans microcarpa x Juglans regia]